MVKQAISQHGVPLQLVMEVLSCHLMPELCIAIGAKEGQYYCIPWDRRVGGMIQPYLTDMLAKTTDKGGQDWDTCLPYVLFTFRCSM